MLLIEFSLPFREPVLVFALVLFIILLAPLVSAALRTPGIIGLLLAGLIVGPYGLGLLARDASIELFGTVGLLYIMFIAGIEIDINDFIRKKNKSIAFGLTTFLIPQVLGTLGSHYLLGYGWAVAALFGSLIAAHTLLSYPIASRLGITRNEAVTITVGGTVIADTLALLVLAVVVGSTAGELNAAFWLRLVISLALLLLVIFLVLPRISRWFFRNVASEGVSQYIFVLAIVFLSGFLAEVAGIEPIIGAFLAGLALNRLIPNNSALMNRVEFVGDAIFIPFFLISVGMLIDLRVLLGGLEAWLVAGFMIVMAVGTKALAAWATQKAFRYSKAERNLIFGLSVSRAAATLAAVLLGYRIGLLDENVLNGSILMILVTALISSFVVESSGKKLAVVESRRKPEAHERPERILVPISNPATIEQLVDLAIMVKDPGSPEPIYPLSVVRDAEDAEDRLVSDQRMLEGAIRHAAATGHQVQIISRIDLNVAGGIIRAVRELMITQVIIGWNGTVTAQQRIFGTVLDNLLEGTQQMIMVTRLLHPLNTIEQVCIVIPHNAGLEKGFTAWVQDVRILIGQVGAKALFLGQKATLRALQQQLEQSRSSISAQYESFSQWNNFEQLHQHVRPDDLLIVVSARRGALSHNKYLDRIPRKLSRHFAQHSFVIIYPEQTHTAQQDNLQMQLQRHPAAVPAETNPPERAE